MKIDIHAHDYPLAFYNEFKTLMERGVVPSPTQPIQPWREEEHLALLNETGLDLQVLSLSLTAYLKDKAACVGLIQAANDGFAEICARHPERFVAFAALPLVDVDTSLRELHRAVNDLGMKGVILGTNVLGEPLDGEALYPVYEELNRLELPVLIHPMDPGGPAQAYEYRLDLYVGWPTDTTLAVARLILSGALDRFPNMKLILSHLGGSTHYLLERISEAGRHFGRMERPLRDYYHSIYYDTAGPVSSSAVLCAHRLFGAGQILFGTDYPFGSERGRDYIQRAVASVEELALPAPDQEAIFFRNTQGLLKLPG